MNHLKTLLFAITIPFGIFADDQVGENCYQKAEANFDQIVTDSNAGKEEFTHFGTVKEFIHELEDMDTGSVAKETIRSQFSNFPALAYAFLGVASLDSITGLPFSKFNGKKIKEVLVYTSEECDYVGSSTVFK